MNIEQRERERVRVGARDNEKRREKGEEGKKEKEKTNRRDGPKNGEGREEPTIWVAGDRLLFILVSPPPLLLPLSFDIPPPLLPSIVSYFIFSRMILTCFLTLRGMKFPPFF